MRWLIATSLILAAVAAPAFVFLYDAKPKRTGTAVVAHELVDEGKPVEALELLQQVSTDTISEVEQDVIETAARAELRDVFTLSSMYDRKPETVIENEKAARLIARTAIKMKDTDTLDKVEERWAVRGTEPHAWLCLRADRLLAEGKTDEARELLESQEFDGEQDAGRLTRLAMLSATGDLSDALALLDRAVSKAPKSGDAHAFRAQVLESLGRIKEARVEYVTAAAAAPENPFFRLHLADFYQRRNNYYLALDSWEDATEVDGGEIAWMKMLFWSRVTNPRAETMPEGVELPGRYNSLAQLIQRVPTDMFWDEDAFQASVDAAPLARTSQEVYWLRLLENLRVGNDEEALRLIESNRFRRQSWNVVLEDALASLLNYRLRGVLRGPDLTADGAGDVHRFVQQLLAGPTAELSAELGVFLETKEAIPAVLLACGWMEAALKMPCKATCPNEAPHYLGYAMCQAYRSNRTPQEAITFAMHQKESPEIDVLVGEMQYAVGKKDEAIASWRVAATDQGAAGYRAAWLLGVELLSRGRVQEAEFVISDHEDLSNAVAGKELLARIALLRGDVRGAEEIYATIRSESLQARVFEIRRRLVAGDLETAKELAQQLLAAHPDAPSVRKLIVDLNDYATSQASAADAIGEGDAA